MTVNLSPSVVTSLFFVWTALIVISHGTESNENKLGSSFFFYQQSTYPRDCKEIHDQCSSHNSTGVFTIKPDGYSDPFEVFCDSTDNLGGWTVIERRVDGAIDFNRSWESYKFGFGFLSQELWIGNERLSFLTNQKRYQLVIEMTTFSDFVNKLVYDNFRISDEFTNYKLVNVGEYSGVIENITFCGTNMLFGNCNDVCQRTCEAPNDCQNNACTKAEDCVCPEGFFIEGDECVHKNQCGCYVEELQKIILEGEFYVNVGCTRKGTCTNGAINWDDSYECDSSEVCEVRDDIRQCFPQNTCSDCKDCQEIYDAGFRDNGLYMITPTDWPGSAFEVYCNMTDGGGWTVFQRRVDGSEDFYLGWDSYKEGFGNNSHEFWLGNDKLHYLTKQKTYEIRIDLVNRYGAPYYAKFDLFRINDESDNYRLSDVGSYSGTADTRSSPDGIQLKYHLNYEFTTKDRDNDDNDANCAIAWDGAWWYNGCHRSNLNALYGSSSLWWIYLPGHGGYIKFTEMKIRPI